jgi:hypothetical protein
MKYCSGLTKCCSVLLVALLLAVSPAVAQKKYLRKFFREYGEDAYTFKIGVGRIPLKLASWIVPASAMKENKVPLKQLLSKVQRIKVYLIAGDEDMPVSTGAIQKLKQTLIEKERFEQLVEVRDKGSIVHLLSRGKDDELGNVVILVQDEHDFVMVNLQTHLHVSDVNLLIQGFAKN